MDTPHTLPSLPASQPEEKPAAGPNCAGAEGSASRCPKCNGVGLHIRVRYFDTEDADVWECQSPLCTSYGLLWHTPRPKPHGSCLICGYDKPFGVWKPGADCGVCVDCRDAGNRLRGVLLEIADEAARHGEPNPISGITRLPKGYAKIIEMAHAALPLPNNKPSNAGENTNE